MGTPEQPTLGPVRRRLADVFPCPAVALFVLAGLTFEALALLVRPDSVYRTDGVGVWTVLAALAWFWLTAGWLVWAVAAGLDVLGRRGPRWLLVMAWAAAACALAGGVVAYA